MDNISRTVYGSYVQTCLYLDRPIQYFENTTLNEKLNVLKDVKPATTEKPVLKYFSIGNRGHATVVGPDGMTKPEPVPHRATDAAPYGIIPFVLRLLTNDLTTTERAKYALRRIEEHDGQQYAAYYLKRIDLSGVSPSMLSVSVSNNVETQTPFVPSENNLSPTAPATDSEGNWIVSGDYSVVKAIIQLVINEVDATEFLNVASILYGDSGYAIISDIALCHGVDKVTSVSNGTSSFNMTEAIGVQVASFVPSFYSMRFSSTGADINLNVGASEPMWNMIQDAN